MPIIQLESFGPFGLVFDQLPHNLAPEVFSEGLNVRFNNSYVEKFKGHKEIYGTALDNPVWAMSWTLVSGTQWFYASNNKLFRIFEQVGETALHEEITRQEGGLYNSSFDEPWQGVVFGGIPIINNQSDLDPPQRFDAVSSRMKDLENWPAKESCKVIKNFGNFLVALNITTSFRNFPYVVRWSDAATPGNIPDSWEALSTNKAGEVALTDTPGFVVDCLPLGNINCIYKTDSVWGMQFIGGVSVFRFYKFRYIVDILASRCVASLDSGRHIVLTTSDVIVHDGQSRQSVIDFRNREYLFNTIHKEYINRAYVKVNSLTQEAWICYVSNSGDSELPDTALVWNYSDNTWGVRELPKAPWIEFGSVVPNLGNDTFDTQTQFIDTDTSIIDSGVLDINFNNKFLIVDFNEKKFYEADITDSFNGEVFKARLSRVGLALSGVDRQGAATTNLTLRKFLRGVYPKIQSSEPVNFYLGAQDNINGPITWQGPFIFNPETDQKIDCRINTRLLAITIESQNNASWRLYGLSLDLDLAGRATS